MIETERLLLRPWQPDEGDALAALLMDATTMQHWPAPLSRADSDVWLARNIEQLDTHGVTRWCCQQRVDAQIVGDVGIRYAQVDGQWAWDLGYIIDHRYWRRGYGFEAATGVIGWTRSQAAALGISALVATMAVDNEPSAALARRLGMRLDRRWVNPGNRDKESYYFELIL